ncbi:MAG: glutamine--fructose-6-phosphate aminotransferase, partial [Eubacterium sp.]
MCGIIGYTGYSQARDVLLKGLKSLEYRGYDSAGIAVFNDKNNSVTVTKTKGRVENLQSKCDSVVGNCGIGHTRWATHGEVSDTNSHPHKFGRVTLVHNGIIENYTAIANQLGINSKLKSQTDSEVVAALIDKYYSDDAK